MTIALSIVASLVVLIAVLSAIAPTRVAYVEEIVVDASVTDVYDDIRLQSRLMRWSAWPKETRSQCAVDTTKSGEDGAVGARTVFVSKGKAVGHQEITRLEDKRVIAMTLEGPGPPHTPKLVFELDEQGPSRTLVRLVFENRFPRPFNAIWRFAGLTKWTRTLHRKDLDGLKAFSEPPHVDADGRVVGRNPSEPNPYEVELAS